MGWSWRSKESYGDKSADHDSTAEGRDALERAAEAADRKSWWDQFEPDSPRFDDTTSDGYMDDWRGYQGPTSTEYSYDKSIDDSDDRWYRKSSFRYGGYKDYSPSSLFRSAFYTPRYSSFYSEENELKNKAIRALRTLTRNANTVCNKESKINYAVQYSAGVDTNSFEETLIDGKKQKTIYVSPDAVVKATTTEDEDAAVDALTGFVLLRVQIAQAFNEQTIGSINNTTLRSLPRELMRAIVAGGAVSGKAIAATHVDTCLAGMLAKGILTRLARRQVVKDWGGFAPYFVRHAKKFMAVREKLAEAELSVESVVGQISYNMIDDENPFEFSKEIDAIITKHLGEEVPPDTLLPACLALILELREHIASLAPDAMGPIEKTLGDTLDEFIQQHAENMANKQAHENEVKDALSALADAMNEQFVAAANEANTHGESKVDANDLSTKINSLYSAEQFLQTLKQSVKELSAHLDALQTLPPTAPERPFHESRAKYAQAQLEARLQHFAPQMSEFEAKGVKKKINPKDYVTADPGKYPELLAKQISDIEEFAGEGGKAIKKEVLKLREQVAELAQKALEKTAAAREDAARNVARIKELRDSLMQAAEKTDNPHIADIANAAHSFENYVASFADKSVNLEAKAEAIKNCRSVRTLRSEYTKFMHEHNSLRFNYDPRNDYGWAYNFGGTPTGNFVNDGIRHYKHAAVAVDKAARAGTPSDVMTEIEKTNWEVNAIKNYLQRITNSGGNFEDEAIRSANEEIFAQLEKMFTEKDSDIAGVPMEMCRIENPDTAKAVERLAQALGISANELLQIYHETNNETCPSTLAAVGREIGAEVRKLLPLFEQMNPVDDQLFGAPVFVETKTLAEALDQVNDEARNDPEEEYVAYLSHNDAKPHVRIERTRVTNNARAIAKDSRSRQRGVIARIREALQFQNDKRTGELYGVRSGDLDEGGLHKLGYDCEHIWSQKTVSKLPDVAVGILVDQSGSMSSSSKITQAREMCIALAEAVKKIPGVHLHIYGHTANMQGQSDLVLYEHYSSTSDSAAANADLSQLGAIDAFCNNYDGYAIKETAKLLAKDPAKRKYLFVIADGLPHGEGYEGKDAEKHVNSVCQFVRERLKIATYAFAVGVNGSHQRKFIEQYGKNHVVFLTTVQACLPQITRFLRNSLQKEKTLVEMVD